ncbi:MAG: hypothetical protein AB1758_31445, partial [Candidatus Eremiobacterota bacterium]
MTIQATLDSFLEATAQRLPERRLRLVRQSLTLLQRDLEARGPDYLTPDDRLRYAESGGAYCRLFGADRLGEHLPRFVASLPERGTRARAAVLVTRRLSAWLRRRRPSRGLPWRP